MGVVGASMELEKKVRTTDDLSEGDRLLLKQGQLKMPGLKILKIDGTIVHVENDDGRRFEFDLTERGRRWALYTLKPPVEPLPPEPGEETENERLREYIRELEKRLAQRDAPKGDFAPFYRRLCHHFRTVARVPERVFDAHMSGGFLRIAPLQFKTWCRHNRLDADDFSKWLVAQGFLVPDARGAHPKSNVSRSRMLRVVPA